MRRLFRRRKPRGRIEWEKAPDVQKDLARLVVGLELTWVDPKRIICFRSVNSRGRSVARIWGFGKIWQMALNQEPVYCLEVIAERYDKLSKKDRDKVLLHELAHVPRNFSGALVAHTRKGKGSFHDKLETMIRAYNKL